jgi:hypothetical protein
MPRKKSKKHPLEMTDDEALKHIFHPKIVKAVKKAQLESVKKPSKSAKA